MPDERPISPAIAALQTFITSSIETLVRDTADALPSTESLLFLGSWSDTIPRLLIEDPVLEPTDKVVWQVIKLNARPGNATVFPTYKHICRKSNIRSEATVARAIAILRACRWLTLCARVRDAKGRFRGNVHALYDEPLGLADTLYLDPDHMAFLHRATGHFHARVRAVATAALATIEDDVHDGADVTVTPNALETRVTAMKTVYDGAQGGFYSFNSHRLNVLMGATEAASPDASSRDSTAAPTSESEAGDNLTDARTSESEAGSTSNFEVSKSEVRSSSSYRTTTTTTIAESSKKTDDRDAGLIFPAQLNDNHQALARLYLETLPPQHHQSILDELEGRMRAERRGAPPVYDPIRFLKRLCDAVGAGEFTANLGITVRKERERAMKSDDAIRASRAASSVELPPANPNDKLVQRAMAIQAAQSVKSRHAPTGDSSKASTPERPSRRSTKL